MQPGCSSETEAAYGSGVMRDLWLVEDYVEHDGREGSTGMQWLHLFASPGQGTSAVCSITPMFRRQMSRQLAALAVSMLALSGCSREPIEVQLRDAMVVEGKWTFKGEPITGLIHDQYKDGKARVRWELRDGLLHGVVREYWQNGQQSTETNFEAGQRHGLNRYWDRNGVLMKEQMYDHDTSLSEKFWPNGEPEKK
jgi:hypothetical protein